MHLRNRPGGHASFLVKLSRLLLLFLPPALLVMAGQRYGHAFADLFWLGALFQLLACLLLLVGGRGWREPLGLPGAMLCIIALSWLVLAAPGASDGFLYVARAILIILPLGFFASQCLAESGAYELRRARKLARRLAWKRYWPEELGLCGALPEVREFREALRLDAGPALALLTEPFAQVRVAALAALRQRRYWLPGQPEAVLHLARHAAEPEVRAAAVDALAALEDRITVEALAEFLRDPDRRVRDATAEALLANTEQRWAWIREEVRAAMSAPVGKDDGPLCPNGHNFTGEAVTDLTAWACEKGVLALRAALTLGAHADQVLSQGQDPKLAQKLRDQVVDVHASPLLRLELARVLQQHHELDEVVVRGLIDPATPAPLRLIAVETLLSRGESPEATAALHDLARLPNREIALATAEVLQRRLGVDVGLPRNQPLPAVNSRLAADVARKVQMWSSRKKVAHGEESGEW
jgi:hypothetical protein